MADNEMKIILEMIDKASPEFKKANAQIISEIKKTEDVSTKASTNIDNGLKQSAKELRAFRMSIIPLVTIFGSIIVVTKEWAKTNEATSKAFNEIGNSTKQLASSIGSLLAPSITGLSQIIKKSTEGLITFFNGVKKAYAELFDTITFAIQYVAAFNAALFSGQNIATSHSVAMNIAAKATEEMGTKFRETMSEVNLGYSLLQQSENNLSDLRKVLSDQDSLRKRVAVDEDISLLKFYEQNFRTALQGMAALKISLSKTMSAGLSSAISNIVTGVNSAKEAFAQLGKSMIQAIIQFMVQKLVASVLEKTILAGTVADSVAAAGAVAAAWATPAALVSLATFGANAVPAEAGIASVVALTSGLAIASSAMGVASSAKAAGEISAPALGVGAGVSAGFGGFQADGGDYVVNRPTAFIAGEAGPERATFTPLRGNGSIGSGEVNIYIANAVMDNSQSIARTAEELGFAVERSLRSARGI